jgi:hypothetical protein
MLHFAKLTAGASPINDDQGQAGTTIFGDVILDGTVGGPGDTRDVSLYLFNDDNTKKYNAPVLSIVDADAVAEQSWFRMLDDENVAGLSPTEAEWLASGVSGTLTLTIGEVSRSGGATPERKFWLRVSVPASVSTQNLTGIKMKAQSVEEAV